MYQNNNDLLFQVDNGVGDGHQVLGNNDAQLKELINPVDGVSEQPEGEGVMVKFCLSTLLSPL